MKSMRKKRFALTERFAQNCIILLCIFKTVFPLAAYAISKEDIAFGESQVKQMIIDRPQMGILVQPGDQVWKWTVRQFAGEYTNSRYCWKNQPGFKPKTRIPRGRFELDAWHGTPHKGQLGWITIESSNQFEPRQGEYMWAGVVYELLNIRNDNAFRNIWKRAASGTCTKADFVRETTQLEYNSLRVLKLFFDNYWEPNLSKSQYRPIPRIWHDQLPSSYEQWISRIDAQTPAYAMYYDDMYRQLQEFRKFSEPKKQLH